MPIIIPTADEIERMDSRQRAALAKRYKNDWARAAKSVQILTYGSIVGLQIANEAREIEKAIGPDPDAAAHVAALLEAIA
jgi:hypothetical protein